MIYFGISVVWAVCLKQLKVWMNWVPFFREGFLDQDMGPEDAGAALDQVLVLFCSHCGTEQLGAGGHGHVKLCLPLSEL
ncbi:hypothetical protein KOW79_006437 [Hemibagrus wyckioides]|uniref:Uncharacterized protein n=1 Tax=Hemibagrus wyckioides TaxID=337641 RepID=A0A9D3SNY7_9TELE|nr:hypothetical protein KOW79_006437 [Hemibagrus wyckioides]